MNGSLGIMNNELRTQVFWLIRRNDVFVIVLRKFVRRQTIFIILFIVEKMMLIKKYKQENIEQFSFLSLSLDPFL